jgi:hypothetical protein
LFTIPTTGLGVKKDVKKGVASLLTSIKKEK